jgi:hypothetical protein
VALSNSFGFGGTNASLVFPSPAGIVRPIHRFAIFAPHSPATQYGRLLVAYHGQCGRTGAHSSAGRGLIFIADHA